MKILFLLKKNEEYGNYSTKNSGLRNSTVMLVEELERAFKLQAKVETCRDENSIDRELFSYRPNVCVLEAIWTTPKKIKELVKLHPNVKFIVRVHSEIPFLANEGNAMDWLTEFVKIDDVYVSFNSHDAYCHFKHLVQHKALYLPNVYSKIDVECFKLKDLFRKRYEKDFVDVGCFGAIRPMKNQLLQAVAAIHFADERGLKLRFHVNAGRVEQKGDNVLKNLKGLFKDSSHVLVEHGWLDKPNFLNLVKKMDVGMQCSFNESFNIVTADFVYCDVPIIVSGTIDWMPKIAQCDYLSVAAMVKTLNRAIERRSIFTKKSKKALNEYNVEALNAWSEFLK